jgi:TRAP-type C4-dicarboxylate transport system permease large subunit
MKTTLNSRLFGFFGFAGFLGFLPGLYYLYVLFMFFFFFAYARPKTEGGKILSDERWAKNVTKASRNAFYVFLLPSILTIAFLRTQDLFLPVSEAIPIAALLSFAVCFVYYDLKGD